MLESVRNAFKIKDIRNRLLYTFVMLVIIRLGCQLPISGVNREYFSQWFSNLTGDNFTFFNAFTGGSFENMSIFALNITPYITSSIIIELLTIAIPYLEEKQRDGEEGRKVLVAITRYVTIGLALIESSAMAIGFYNQGILDTTVNPWLTGIMIVTGLTAGSALLMWIGEQITENGVGNGISIVLVINIISRMPSDLYSLFNMFVKSNFDEGKALMGIVAALVIIAIILATVVLTLLLNGAERHIPVQYAKKVVGRKMVGGNSTNIPLKVNTGGVIPIIFASSLMQFPIVICQLFGIDGGTSLGGQVLRMLNSGNWCNPANPVYTIGLLVYIVLVIFFAYFYTSITFNPLEVSENLKKQGGFIPGIRPGRPTNDYLTNILNYVIFIGAVGLVIVAVIPIFFNGVFGANVSFGGTSLIIIVGVILETLKQIESRMLVRSYKGFLG
ncbi:MAG: preprotein translocase subunit SecY [Lachnospiraceae bacterium]|nr:preprotein translocase subunit SecY [Lachnospiraceae bacterium]MDN4744447.1 preprotein translocase subunit SecY [Lachnospiraceae bacterium C1.1]